MIWAVIKKEQD